MKAVSAARMAARLSSRLASRPVARAPLAARSLTVSARRLNEKKEPKAPEPEAAKSGSSSTGLILTGVAAAVAGYAYYAYSSGDSAGAAVASGPKTFEDYQKVYDAIAKKMIEEDDYDDGSYGPVLVRLAWHSSGTYDKHRKDGGSGPGTMRFEAEVGHGANAGLKAAMDFLEPIHKQFPWISYGDLYTLGGVVGVQELQGPDIPWRPGRVDGGEDKVTEDGRLPDASQGAQHQREVFQRMGFDDQELSALVGAHALGRCHPDRSGFDGPWTFSPTVFTNDFYKLLLQEDWNIKKWNGPRQYEDTKTKSLMMLPADFAFRTDKRFREWCEKYAADNDLFFRDFAKAYVKLLELGVDFKGAPQWTFKRLD